MTVQFKKLNEQVKQIQLAVEEPTLGPWPDQNAKAQDAPFLGLQKQNFNYVTLHKTPFRTCVYIFKYELSQTTKVQQRQHENVVGCLTLLLADCSACLSVIF